MLLVKKILFYEYFSIFPSIFWIQLVPYTVIGIHSPGIIWKLLTVLEVFVNTDAQ